MAAAIVLLLVRSDSQSEAGQRAVIVFGVRGGVGFHRGAARRRGGFAPGAHQRGQVSGLCGNLRTLRRWMGRDSGPTRHQCGEHQQQAPVGPLANLCLRLRVAVLDFPAGALQSARAALLIGTPLYHRPGIILAQ